MKEMVGGCCVCSDERGWTENPLVYCDGQGCTVAVHQACYGIVTVPVGPWYCRKCESQERAARVRCELCPSRDGALKRTDNAGWAHVVCALYIPEVRFGNVTTMEPIILQLVPPERFNKMCYICQDMSKGTRASIGACMQCNKTGCRQQFHVTCAQALGLLCEEAGNYLDNVKYCGYCQHHYGKLKKAPNIKAIPPYKPISNEHNSSDSSPEKELDGQNATTSIIQMHQSKAAVIPPMVKPDLQSKVSNRKSVSGGKIAPPAPPTTTSAGTVSGNSSSSQTAVMKTLTVNLSKEKHLSKPVKSTTQSKSSDKDKSSKVSKTITSTNSTPSQNTTSKISKQEPSDSSDRKTPNTLEKSSEKNSIKRDQKDSSKFTHSNFTESVVVPSEPIFGDKEGLAIKLSQGQLKKRKADSRTSTPVPDNQSVDQTVSSGPPSSNVIVTPMDTKDENHKKIKTEHSPSPPLQIDTPMSTMVASTIPKTESVSPVPQSIQPTSVSQPTSLVVSVPLSTASSAMSQMSNNLYQHLPREPHERLSPALNNFIDRRSPLTPGLNDRSSNSPLNIMSHNQSVLTQGHQIGAVANLATQQALGVDMDDTSQSGGGGGGGLKIAFEKQVKIEVDSTKRSRSQTNAKAVAAETNNKQQQRNKKRTVNNKVNKQNAISTITSTSSSTQNSIANDEITTSSTITQNSLSQNSSIIITELSNDVRQQDESPITQLPTNKRSSRSHPTPPPVSGSTNVQASLGSSFATQNSVMGLTPKDSPSPSPSPDEQPKRKGRKPLNQNASPAPDSKQDIKIFQNGVHAPHMLGNQLNPNSNMAQKMSDHLNHELEAHSVFTGDQDGNQGALIGPALLRNTARSGNTTASATNPVGSLMSGVTNSSSTAAVVPQSLDQLLERQWEQGSQFLMEQAQHFDIASLLSCLHQLRTENVRLEDHVNSLVARRDHLLAVNARLAIPLTQPQATGGGQASNTAADSAAAATRAMRPMVNNPTENGIVSQDVYRTQQTQQVRHSPASQYSANAVNIQQQQQQQQQHGGNIRSTSSGRGGGGGAYQPYSVVTSQPHQVVVRRDENHLPQKPPN